MIGKEIGSYKLVSKIGEGGMGEVYEAAHVYIDKKFAIKLLRPEITTNQEAVARFHQEARTASSIGHENIVSSTYEAPLLLAFLFLPLLVYVGWRVAARRSDRGFNLRGASLDGQALPRGPAVGSFGAPD